VFWGWVFFFAQLQHSERCRVSGAAACGGTAERGCGSGTGRCPRLSPSPRERKASLRGGEGGAAVGPSGRPAWPLGRSPWPRERERQTLKRWTRKSCPAGGSRAGSWAPALAWPCLVLGSCLVPRQSWGKGRLCLGTFPYLCGEKERKKTRLQSGTSPYSAFCSAGRGWVRGWVQLEQCVPRPASALPAANPSESSTSEPSWWRIKTTKVGFFLF